MYKNLETLLVTATNGKESEEHFKLVTHFYGTDLTQSRLKAQLALPNVSTMIANKQADQKS